jgi:hypothetical protein
MDESFDEEVSSSAVGSARGRGAGTAHSASGIDSLGLSEDAIRTFQRSAGIAQDGIMGPQTRAAWERAAVAATKIVTGAAAVGGGSAASGETGQKGAVRRVRKSRHIAQLGAIDLWEIPDGGLTGLNRFDAIVVPVDGGGTSGQFMEGLRDVDPALGERIDGALATRRNSKKILRKAEALELSGPPLVIAAIGSVVGSSLRAATADLVSATNEALGTALGRGATRLLFPLLSVGSAGGGSDAAATAFFRGLLATLNQMPDTVAPLEVHLCTRDQVAMSALKAMLRKEEEERRSIERPDETDANPPQETPQGAAAAATATEVSGPGPGPTRQALRLATPGYRTDSLTDEPRDFVGVGAEILAFARLAASREIEPPLAVGVFGDWGSGKSFFMNGVRRKIEKLGAAEEMRIAKARKDGAADPASGIHTNVVQIEFNTWHYIETNLWASLVEYIFSRLEEWLRARNEGEADNGGALFESLATSRQLKLDTARSVMSANAELNAARKATAQEELDRAEKLMSKKAALSAFFRVTIDDVANSKDFAQIRIKLASLGLTKVDASAEDLQRAVEELRQTGGRSKLFWEAARTQAASPYAWFAVVSLLLLPVAIPPAINWVLGRIDADARLPELLTGASAALMTAAGLIKAFLGKVKPALDQAERFAAKVHEKMGSLEAAATGKEEKALADAQAAAAEAEKQLAAAQERLRLAAAQAADAQNRYTAESARGRLNRFIRERLADGTYGKHLGLIATIRKDFEQLTALVSPSPENKGEQARYHEEEQAYRLRVEALIAEAAAAEGEDLLGDEARAMLNDALTNRTPPRVFERIVLYIDDLDRCPPDRVVEVLQAVHMLLSFRLFVVFVAVDARWVTCALREVYEHQLDKGGGARAGDVLPGMGQNAVADMATAEDYMEKIFQIPYWVRPIQGEAAGGFMRKLVQSFGVSADTEDSREDRSGPGGTAEAENDGSPARGAALSDGAALDGLEAQDDDGGTEGDAEAEMTAEEEEAIVAFAKAAKLELIQEDMEALAALAPVVGDSPRRIKRFFNTYLLIQSIASVAVNEESADIDPETRAQMTRMLEGCSLAQQTLALAASLALAMQEEKAGWLDAATIAGIEERQLKDRSIDGKAMPSALHKVLSAYVAARKPDDAFPDGYRAAFDLFLPIARRYGFHERTGAPE